jgi:phosphoadenosine phosphosulfate reductase
MKAEVEELSKILAGHNLSANLSILSQRYSRIVFSTSFGKEDQVITHAIATGDAREQVNIFTLDTGRLFEDTYETYHRTLLKYKMEIRAYFPNQVAVQELLEKKGPFSFYDSVENRKECCFIRKIEPLKRALAGNELWITGLRRAQSDNRGSLPIAEWDETNQVIKVHPLIDWSEEDVDDYVNHHNVPVNPLHKKGFPSIGCAPCTRAVEPGEDIRAGRWWWEASKKECGLHAANPSQ